MHYANRVALISILMFLGSTHSLAGIPQHIEIGKSYEIGTIVGMGKKRTMKVIDIDRENGWLKVSEKSMAMRESVFWINSNQIVSIRDMPTPATSGTKKAPEKRGK